MPAWLQNLQSKLASYYREYEFVTAIYVLEPWEKRWANGKKKMKDKNHFVRKSKRITMTLFYNNYHFFLGVVAVTLAIALFSTIHYLPHYTATMFEYFKISIRDTQNA